MLSWQLIQHGCVSVAALHYAGEALILGQSIARNAADTALILERELRYRKSRMRALGRLCGRVFSNGEMKLLERLYKSKVRQRHELERQIVSQIALPPNVARKKLISQLTSKLAAF